MTEAEALTRALGGLWRNGSGMARCPAHDDRTPSLSIKAGEGGRLLLRCFAGCGFEEILEAARWRGALAGSSRTEPRPAPDPVPRKPSCTSAAALAVLDASEPLPGTPAEVYLRGARAISCALPFTLRYHRRCRHLGSKVAPSLIARIDDGEGFAIHRIALRPDGSDKADFPNPKSTLGLMGGGAVRLSGGSEVLAIGEGIETSLSLLCGLLAGNPAVWSAVSSSNMSGLRLPPARGRKLIVAMDGDGSGRKGGAALAERADAEGWKVFLFPAPEGRDWNDVLRAGRAAP